jgi:hypothetical protein
MSEEEDAKSMWQLAALSSRAPSRGEWRRALDRSPTIEDKATLIKVLVMDGNRHWLPVCPRVKTR